VTIHVGGRERLEPAISKATTPLGALGALGTEALVWIGATSIRGSAAALRGRRDRGTADPGRPRGRAERVH